MKDMGLDVRDPLRLLYVLKNMGAATFEEAFGVGRENGAFPRNREPVVPNDVFEQSNAQFESFLPLFRKNKNAYQSKKILLASSDVHVHALYIMERLLEAAGASVVSLGAERGPSDIAQETLRSGAQAILISTHNGMALEYAHSLQDEMKERGISVPIMMGGVLNQKTDTSPYPADVSEDLQRMGIKTSGDISDLIDLFRDI